MAIFLKLLVVALLLIPSLAHTEVLISEDFEGFGASWNCGQTTGQGIWDTQECRSVTGGGYNTQTGVGYNSTKGLDQRFNSNSPNVYNLMYTFNVDWPASAKTIYNRWYMKVDTALTKSIAQANSLKFWRYYAPNNTYEIYVHLLGSSTATAYFDLETNYGGTTNYNLVPFSTMQDGQWHCYEIRIKLNSSGSSYDGEIDFWIDGTIVPAASHRNIRWFGATNPVFGDNIQVGVGNTSDEPWNNATTAAMSFDNFVLSTEYIGPVGGGGSAASTAIGVGTSTIGAGTTSITTQ